MEFYKDVILRKGHDNSEMLDMTNSNMSLSGELILHLLAFMEAVAIEVECPGGGHLPAKMKVLLSEMNENMRRKKMASFLIILGGLLSGRELGPLKESCLRLASNIRIICNRFLSSN